jgi:hypothetical protein
MILLKGCARCHGDLLLVMYMDERSTNCLQCGFTRGLPMSDARDEPRVRSIRPVVSMQAGA